MECATGWLRGLQLVLHPEKTKIVYCKDGNRRSDFGNQSFDFLGFTFRARKALGRGRRPFACFLPAASPKALTSISRTVRRWALHHRSDKFLQDLAEMYNPCIRGLDQLLQPLLQDAVASDPEEDRSLCHPLGAPQVQAVASEDQGGERLV